MPTYPALSLSFEDRLTLHFQEFGEKKLNSQAWPRSPIVEMLSANAKPYEGGSYITETIEDGYTPTGTAIDEGSTIPASQKNISLPAMYQPRWVYESIYLDSIRGFKIDTGGPMGPIVNWAQAQVESAGRAIRENLALMLCASTTGTAADGSTYPCSLFDVVKTTGSLGGIDPTQFTWWKGVVDTTAGAWSSTGPARVRTALRTARKYTGFSGPDSFFASATAIDAMKAGGYTKSTFFRSPSEAKGYDVGDGAWHWSAHAPFDPDLMFDGIPVYYDPHLDALETSSISTGGLILGLNSKAVFLRQRPGTVFSVQPWQKSENKLGMFTRVLWGGQLCAVNRSSNILVASIT